VAKEITPCKHSNLRSRSMKIIAFIKPHFSARA
jgi:hypothetical protein